ncbi:MAG: 5'-nucleotidase C-terminal domain-containing protein [Bacteroidia bacterium]
MQTSLLRKSIIASAFILMYGCATTPKISKVESSMIELNAKAPDEKEMDVLVNPYKAKMDSIMNEVLGTSDSALLKGLPESSLGDFVADAVLKKANEHYHPADGTPADICLLNNGGLRSQLPKGKITLGNVFELMPFENMIVIVTIKGDKMKQLFESLVENNGAPFSGAEIKAKGKKITLLKIGGKDLDPAKNYKVVTSDYLAGGGDKYNFFNSPVSLEDIQYKLRDAIVDEIRDENKKGSVIKSRTDGRIIYE